MLRLQGASKVRHGFLLIPLDTVEKSIAERDITGLAGSFLQQCGSFTNLPEATEHVNTGREWAKKIRKTIEDGDVWECAVPTVRGQGRVYNRMLRAQNGPLCYLTLFANLLNTTTRKFVTVFDWIASVGDRAEGALITAANPSQCNSSRLFYTGFENRPILYETARARVRHLVGQKYLDMTLSVNDRVPVLPPVSAPDDDAKASVKRLKLCSIQEDQSIAVPLFPEQAALMPFASSHPDIHMLFRELEDEFPKIFQVAREKWETAREEGENNQAETVPQNL